MAKIGNETKLILKLAEEKIKSSTRLQKEIEFRGLPGNYPEKLTWQQALAIGYNVGVSDCQTNLHLIVSNLEAK